MMQYQEMSSTLRQTLTCTSAGVDNLIEITCNVYMCSQIYVHVHVYARTYMYTHVHVIQCGL